MVMPIELSGNNRMIPGRKVLGDIDHAISEVHSKIAEQEQRTESLTEQVIEQQQAMAEDYRELAKVRLGQLLGNADEVSLRLDQAEQQVFALFKQRREALASLQGEISKLADKLQTLADERAEQIEQVDQAAEILDEAEAKTQLRLGTDQDYQKQLHKVEEADGKAGYAEEKAKRSEEELEQKGVSYRDDPLFMYLWQRDYGLTAYQSGDLIRWLDDKVARMIGFADARANYTRLNEIPQRLREHAVSLRAEADEEFALLKAMDQDAREEDGIYALEKSLQESQTSLDALDRELEQQGIAEKALLNQKRNFATGEDKYSQRALEFLANEFKRDDLRELRLDALRTPSPDDDLIISRMLDRERQLQDINQLMDGMNNSVHQHYNRLSELEKLRIDFKHQRYDRNGSVFGDNAMVGMMLTQFLEGMLDRNMLWKVLQQQQRYHQHSNPDFGSGGFGQGSVWNEELGDMVGEIGRDTLDGIGSGVFNSGGGFRTGGGF